VPSSAHLLAFVVASIILIEIPGPSLLFALGRALTVGRRDAVLSVVGNALGLGVQIAAVGLGLGALVAASATAFTVLKVVGVLYVAWLGVQAIRHRAEARLQLEAAQQSVGGAWNALRTGAIVGATNPKTVVFFGAFLPQFVTPGRPAAMQILVLGVVFAILAVASDVCWVLAASRAKSWFARRPQRLDAMSVAGGTMMIGLGAVMATTTEA
jgi:threonine/homoserine/homoserine lactone efflux protein